MERNSVVENGPVTITRHFNRNFLLKITKLLHFNYEESVTIIYDYYNNKFVVIRNLFGRKFDYNYGLQLLQLHFPILHETEISNSTSPSIFPSHSKL